MQWLYCVKWDAKVVTNRVNKKLVVAYFKVLICIRLERNKESYNCQNGRDSNWLPPEHTHTALHS
jgi:hypothetical protein